MAECKRSNLESRLLQDMTVATSKKTRVICHFFHQQFTSSYFEQEIEVRSCMSLAKLILLWSRRVR